MAGVKISGMSLVPALQEVDLGVIVDGGVTYKFNVGQLFDFITTQTACRLASTGNLTAAYNNGTAGVGATLTNTGAFAAFSLDGVSANVNDRVLIKDQSTQFQNGVYIVTTVGTGAAAWVLTRSTDYDTPADITPGDLFTIGAGTVNANTQYIETNVVNTVGTDSIAFVSNIVAGAGISKTNNVIAATKNISGIAQIFNTPGAATYTRSANVVYAIVEGVGGGASGGSASGAVGQGSAAGGGGGGGYFRKLFTAAQLGATAAIVIGAGGAASAAGANAGNPGTATTFTPAGSGSVLTGNGGAAGAAGTAGAGLQASPTAAAGGTATNGDIVMKGGAGTGSFSLATGTLSVSGAGGSSYLGIGASSVVTTADTAGNAGIGFGSGGSGAAAIGSNQQGGIGAGGLIIVTEFIFS